MHTVTNLAADSINSWPSAAAFIAFMLAFAGTICFTIWCFCRYPLTRKNSNDPEYGNASYMEHWGNPPGRSEPPDTKVK